MTEFNREDTNRVNLMLRLSKEYQGQSLDSMQALAERALQLSQKLRFDKGEADALVAVAYACIYQGQVGKALQYLQKADPIYEKIRNGRGRILVANAQAIIYTRAGKYDTALDYFNKILVIAEPIHADDHIGKTLVSIGTIYAEMGNFPEAVNYFLKGLKVQERINDKDNVLITLSRIASTYGELEENKKALEFIARCVAADTGKRAAQMRMSAYVNIGSVYGRMENNADALMFFNRALSIADSINDLSWHNICLVDIADIYFNQKKYKEALDAFTECRSGAEKTGQFNIYSSGQLGIGRVLLKTGKTAEGIKYLKEGYDILLKNGVKNLAGSAAKDISEGYESLHDYKSALQYNKICMALKDSIYNEKTGKKIQQLQFDYLLEKKQAQVAIERGKIEKQRSVILGMVVGLALFIIIIILLFRSRQYEKRNAQLIVRQNEEIQLQKAKLEDLNQFKDKTFSVLSHDLRGPINNLTSTMELLDEKLITPEEFIALKPQITRQLDSLNILLDNLLKWSKSHIMGESSLKTQRLNVYKIANDNVNLVLNAAEKKQITIQNNIPEETHAMADMGQVDVVIRNLLNNALKFTNTNGTITLSAAMDRDKVKIYIADDGVGMTGEQMDKLFTSAPDKTTYGTGGEKGIGLGLLLCYEFIKANKGNIEVESEVGKGTTFTIILPV